MGLLSEIRTSISTIGPGSKSRSEVCAVAIYVSLLPASPRQTRKGTPICIKTEFLPSNMLEHGISPCTLRPEHADYCR